MSRRIETGFREDMLAAPPPSQEDFLGRLAKCIPAEIVGLYLAATAPVPKTAGDHAERCSRNDSTSPFKQKLL
jgi:hypothetical protein